MNEICWGLVVKMKDSEILCIIQKSDIEIVDNIDLFKHKYTYYEVKSIIENSFRLFKIEYIESENNINELWRIMPLFYMLHKDKVFDSNYVFKGFIFILSIIGLPISLLLYIIGKLVGKLK